MNKKLQLVITPKAIKDLEIIYEYTLQQWGFVQADNYQDLLFDSMQFIVRNPETGINYPYKKGNFRKLIPYKHLIFYRIEGRKCIIVRVLHEKMDVDVHLI